MLTAGNYAVHGVHHSLLLPNSVLPFHTLEEIKCQKTQKTPTSTVDPTTKGTYRLFELLLGAELVGVTALALAAVGGTGRETGLCGD